MRLATLAVLSLLLMTPPASAWGRMEIEIPAIHVGTTLRYAQYGTGTDTPAGGAYLVQVAALGSTLDAYGVRRDTVTYHEQLEEGGKPTFSGLCHAARGGQDAVRREVLFGAYTTAVDYGWGSKVAGVPLGGQDATAETTYTTHFGGVCDTPVLAPQWYRTGQSVKAGDLFAGGDMNVSAVAKATRFEGRKALSFDFAFDGHAITIVLADGIPAIAHATWRNGEDGGETVLTGIREGTGPAVNDIPAVALAERNPGARFSDAPALSLDLSALPVAYPLKDAITNLRADPQMGLDAWLRAHPGAMLVGASYDSEGRNTPVQGDAFETDGGWSLSFGVGDVWKYWYTSRSAVGFGVGAMLPSATRDVQNFAFDEQKVDVASAQYDFDIAPYQAADTASLVSIMRSEGVETSAIKVIQFFRFQQADGPRAYLRLSDVSLASEENAEGQSFIFDMQRGGLDSIAATKVATQDTGILSLAPGGVSQGGVASATTSFLAGPTGGLGIAAAATGVGLLALLLKFVLIPLYSRLRRDRLLDNPVRARLYERVRAEPGIHRAELVDFAGIGEGATRHHLAQLVSNHLLVELEQDGYARYYAAGEVPPEVARREGILRAGSHRAVYDLYALEPKLSLREAGARLKMSAPSVHRAKKKLTAAGLLPVATGPTTDLVAEA